MTTLNKTVDVKVLTPSVEDVQAMREVFASMAEAISSWDDSANASVVDAMIDTDKSAINSSISWDVLFPDMTVYDTFVRDFAVTMNGDVLEGTSYFSEEGWALWSKCVPEIYLTTGVVTCDEATKSVTTRYYCPGSAPYDFIAEGGTINKVYA